MQGRAQSTIEGKLVISAVSKVIVPVDDREGVMRLSYE
jgi:hypothetical protein